MNTQDDKNKLIIGYGNPYRNDDRVGWYVIENLRGLLPNYVHLETMQQLDMELIERLINYKEVIFIDTHISETNDWVRTIILKPVYEISSITHYLTPGTLLGISKILYHYNPQGILFSVKGTDFNFGCKLSSQTQQAADELIDNILLYVKYHKLNDIGYA